MWPMEYSEAHQVISTMCLYVAVKQVCICNSVEAAVKRVRDSLQRYKVSLNIPFVQMSSSLFRTLYLSYFSPSYIYMFRFSLQLLKQSRFPASNVLHVDKYAGVHT
jgi:hypothetical protein